MATTNPSVGNEAIAKHPWWREAEFAWLILLVVFAYFLRAGELPIRGEESTRAEIAFEMVEGNDWLVPKRFGEPLRIRPPLQNWLIAISCLALGSWSEWAVRFHSMLATLLTTLMIYGYARGFLTRLGAFAAAAAFATLADMFAMGRQAETEALFTFLVSASMFVWHWGWTRGWPDVLSFAAGYSFMALAMLTKGLQAPMYFGGSIGIFLIISGQWRRLFSLSHVFGSLAAVAILLAWIIPYSQAMGWAEVHSIWFGDPAIRNAGISSWKVGDTLAHLVTLPLELIAGTLPWSLLLVPYLSKDFRRSIHMAGSQVQFMTVCLAVAFPSCWIPPGGQPRFFSPLFPCVAVLIGLAIERCVTERDAVKAGLNRTWQIYLVVMAGVMGLLALGMVAVALLKPFIAALEPYSGPPLVTLGYVAATIGLAILILRLRRSTDPSLARFAVLGVAGFTVLALSGAFFDIRVRRSENAPAAMRRLKEQLPPGQQLVSISGQLDCLFPYYYGRPVVRVGSWPRSAEDAVPTYFCFQCPGASRPTLPFAWEEIAAIPLDRNHHAVSEDVVVVGRRLAK